MIELVDTLPDVNVQPAEYKRLLGYPRDRVWSGRARELAEWARSWYLKNAHPWVYARHAERLEISNGSILIDGVGFRSDRLRGTLEHAEAHSVVLVAVCAGVEAEQEAQKAWLEERPDEYFFLEMFASAVVEHLTTMTGARLCAWAETHEMSVLPHYSPGYPEWDIGEQPQLLELIQRAGNQPLPGTFEVLDSGMLRPKKSLLAVFGLTRHMERARRLTDLVPCESCSYMPCDYRRAPYQRTAVSPATELAGWAEQVEAEAKPVEIVSEAPQKAAYTVSVKALRRWAEERLSLEFRADGTVDAVFRYEGTTCTNTGRTLEFDYKVKLGPRAGGYRVLEQQCGPAPEDTGHTYMCRYMNNAEHLMVAIDREKPLLGQPLAEVLTWQRPASGAGCYCEPPDRKHKWGLALETIHYALAQLHAREAQQPASDFSAIEPARRDRAPSITNQG